MDDLAAAFRGLTTDDEYNRFFAVLFSHSELVKLQQRLRAFDMLLDGKSQRQVRDEAGMSIATVSRAAQQVRADRPILEVVLRNPMVKASSLDAKRILAKDQAGKIRGALR